MTKIEKVMQSVAFFRRLGNHMADVAVYAVEADNKLTVKNGFIYRGPKQVSPLEQIMFHEEVLACGDDF
jgi:hypothetical protein